MPKEAENQALTKVIQRERRVGTLLPKKGHNKMV
jgi:hypothetical protein